MKMHTKLSEVWSWHITPVDQRTRSTAGGTSSAGLWVFFTDSLIIISGTSLASGTKVICQETAENDLQLTRLSVENTRGTTNSLPHAQVDQCDVPRPLCSILRAFSSHSLEVCSNRGVKSQVQVRYIRKHFGMYVNRVVPLNVMPHVMPGNPLFPGIHPIDCK